MTIRVLIPAQKFRDAKSRLQARWSDEQRADLARHLLAHVLTTIQASPFAFEPWVLSNDDSVLNYARALGASAQADVPSLIGHGAQLRDALLHIPADEPVIVLMADLPLLDVDDLGAIAQELLAGNVVLAPDRKRLGTNAAGFPSRETRRPHFGNADSFLRHLREFSGTPLALIERPGLQLDLDDEDDLQAIEAQTPPASSFSFWLRGTQAKR